MVNFQGLNSVIDRTLFTHRGPIVKRPLDLLTGSNLQIVSEDEVEISTGNFTSSDVGKTLEVSGSPVGRNDTDSTVKEVLSATRLQLSNVNFDVSDVTLTTIDIVTLANELKVRYNAHRIQTIEVDGTNEGVHGTHDSINSVLAANATDLATAITLLNDIKVKLSAHVVLVSGTPPTHSEADPNNIPVAPDASQLPSAVQLVNEVRRKFEAHREDRFIHQNQDTVNAVTVDPVVVTTGVFPGALTGPFTWTIRDPRLGMVADDPTDVGIIVNGTPAQVDAVYGLLGAVVLTNKPSGSDTVSIDYDFLNNPPARFLRLNSPEFNLNQAGNRGYAGLPKHRYRSRSYLVDPGNSPDLVSAIQPRRVGWKYKGLERSYSATLNDPTTLLLNVPTNRIAYRVLFDQVREETIRYDPVTLPQDATDPWTLEGQGTFSLAAGGSELTIIDSNVQTGPDSAPPFFTHAMDLRSASIISSAFRARVLDDPSTLILDGVFTGVAFGLSDGQRTAVVGFVVTDATNLSSSQIMVNDLRVKFDAHLINLGSHNPDDEDELIGVVAASDLTSLVILLNQLKARFNAHITKGSGVGNVHQTVDGVNVVVLEDAADLDSSVALVNDLRAKFNAHREESLVHFSDDVINNVGQVKQVGILTNRGFSEFQDSWDLAATDWTEHQTYRILFDSDGTASLFLSGDVVPAVSVDPSDLPPISSIDGKFDPVQQAFFGSITRDATSESRWQFIRVNVQPVDGNLIEDNKSVDYDASVVPELDPSAPWITVGQGGAERTEAGVLLTDSTSSAPDSSIDPLGRASGAFRGFIRLEPILTRTTAASVEFRASGDFYTHGLNNSAASFVLDDDNYTIQFAFLQFDPSPATVTGTASEPFTIISGNTLVLRIGDDSTFTVTFAGTDTTVALVAAKINAAVGFTFADNSGGKVRLTTTESGVASEFEIVSGSAAIKLGFSVGKYSGLDSNPEPRISWFGEDFPDLDDPEWVRGGLQSSTMLGRTMRVTDVSTLDYLIFSLVNPLVTNRAFNSVVDWKLNVRLTVRSFIAGDVIPTAAPYSDLGFAGALISVDEGTDGKNVELHLAVDGSGDAFLNLLSFNSGTGALDVVSQYAFNWDDGQPHTFNVYTSKGADSLLVLADGVTLSPSAGPAPTYSGLNTGVTVGPSVSFGSGSEPVTGSDLGNTRSVVDWESVSIFRDSKIGDPTSADRRFVGIFKGGDSSLLSSYYLHQIDWSIPHVYRIIRDPVTSVAVFVDGGATPVISISYDVLTLPPVSSSFLGQVSSNRPTIAFGGFNPQEISRTRWDYVRYSMGRITLTERLIPPHQVTNQHNAVASPDHLFTTKPHSHQGFTVYSGGTPLDDFMADEEVESFTELGEGTPPIPQTQDLESRGGFVKVGTPLDGIPSLTLVNTKGFISDLENDITNVLSLTSSLSQLILLVNDLQTQYEAHRIDVSAHGVADVVNVVTALAATDLTTSITLVNDLQIQYEAHRVLLAGVHGISDTFNTISAPVSTDIESAVLLANDLRTQYGAHRMDTGGSFHSVIDSTNAITASMVEDPTDNAVAVSNEWRQKYLLHVVQYRVHLADDVENIILPEEAMGLTSTISLANAEKDQYNEHRTAVVREIQEVHSEDDSTNAVTASDASDLATLVILVDDLATQYGAHLSESGVHGSSMFIRLDPPSRVLYESMKFWTFEEGEEGHVYPFSDDETLHMDGFRLQNDVAVNYDGSVLPEDVDELEVQVLANDLKAKFNAHRTESGVHPIDDVVNVVTSSAATDLSSAITLLTELKAKVNAHMTQATVHVADDPRNESFSTDPTEVKTAIALANELRLKFETHRVNTAAHSVADVANAMVVTEASPVADLGWRRFDSGAGVASVSSTGSTLLYGTTVAAMTTVYRKETGLPDVTSLRFEVSIRMRINSWSADPNVDTGAYAGFLSSMGPGVAAGIGFDAIDDIPYVKIQDVNSDETLFRVPFDWSDGAFHSYTLAMDPVADSLSLILATAWYSAFDVYNPLHMLISGEQCFTDLTKTTPAGLTDPVQVWGNLGTLGPIADAIQSSVGNRPVLGANGMGFTAASSHHMELAGLTNTSNAYTFVYVVKPDSVAGTQTILGCVAGGDPAIGIQSIVLTDGGKVGAHDGSGTKPGMVATTRKQVFAITADPVTHLLSFYRDGELLATAVYDDTWAWGALPIIGGPAGAASGFISGDLEFSAVFPTVLDATDLAAVHAILSAQYGLEFTPLSVANTKTWQRSDLGVTGNPVESWANQGSLGGNFANPTPANRPAFNALGFGGADSMTYDDTNDALIYDGAIADHKFLHDGTGGSLALIAKPTAIGYMFDTLRNSANRVGLALLYTNATNATLIIGNGSGTMLVNSVFAHSLGAGDGACFVMRMETGAADEFDARVNGVQKANGAFHVSGASAANPAYVPWLGDLADAGFPFGGDIAEVICADRYWSALEAAAIERYAAARYGL